jgi:hypothetical protein
MSDSHTPTPADDEPKTPMWLPALGAALFVGVALVWAVTPASPSIQPEPAAAAASDSVQAAPPAPPPPPPPTMTAVASARPSPVPSGSAQQMNDKLRQLLDQMRQGPGQGQGQPGLKR